MKVFASIIIFLTLAMIPIGFVQLLTALVSYFTTKKQWAKKQYGYYLLGVIAYFLILTPLFTYFDNGVPVGLGLTFFYCGAIALCIYWVFIFRNRDRILPSENRQEVIDPFQA